MVPATQGCKCSCSTLTLGSVAVNYYMLSSPGVSVTNRDKVIDWRNADLWQEDPIQKVLGSNPQVCKGLFPVKSMVRMYLFYHLFKYLYLI